MRKTLLACLGALLLNACGAPAPVAEGSSTTALVGSTTTVTNTTTTTTAPEVPRDTYRYTLTFSGIDGDGEEQQIVLTGAVDFDAEVGEVRYILDPEGSETVIVQSQAGVAVRAPALEMLPSDAGEIDPEAWYELEVFTADGADAFFLSATPTADALWALLDVEPEQAGAVATALIRRSDIEPHWGSNTLLDFIGRSVQEVELQTEDDSDGYLRRVSFSSADEDDGAIEIVITDRGDPVDIAVPDDVLPIPVVERKPPIVLPPPTTLPVQIIPDAEGVLFRLSTTGGWQLPEKPARQFSLTADGLLVRVINPDVFASADDFTAIRLSAAGVERMVAAIEGSGVLDDPGLVDGRSGVSPTDVTVTLWVQGRPVLSMDRVGQNDGYTLDQLAARGRFTRVVELIEDPEWLGDDVLSDWEPWLPASLTVYAGGVSSRSGIPDGAPFAPWPLDESIEDLASGTTHNAYDEEELVVCLVGDQVAPVWELLTGVNNAYLRVDDGTQWELTYVLNWPGYRQYRDEC